MKITGAVLAAGKSSRMGQNKLLLPWNDHAVIEEVLSRLSNADLEDILVITGFEREKIESVIEKRFESCFSFVYNDKYELGRAESIKLAVENAPFDTDAILFMVGDKPTVKSELIDRAITEFKEKQPSILYVKTPQGRGHPIIFSEKLFGELRALQGDTVGNELIEKYQNNVVELLDDEIQVDIDTVDDLNGLSG